MRGISALGAALGLMIAMAAGSSAEACHRFSRWRFPWPQRCGVHPSVYARPLRAAFHRPARWVAQTAPEPAAAPEPEAHDWTVEVTKLPTLQLDESPPNDDVGRTEAIMKLKEKLK